MIGRVDNLHLGRLPLYHTDGDGFFPEGATSVNKKVRGVLRYFEAPLKIASIEDPEIRKGDRETARHERWVILEQDGDSEKVLEDRQIGIRIKRGLEAMLMVSCGVKHPEGLGKCKFTGVFNDYGVDSPYGVVMTGFYVKPK